MEAGSDANCFSRCSHIGNYFAGPDEGDAEPLFLFDLPDRFKEDRREVQLQGEAYFEVEKDARHPFVVKADPVEVEVLGTHFNVEAYPGDAEVKTTLLEGSVAVNAPAVSSGLRFSGRKRDL